MFLRKLAQFANTQTAPAPSTQTAPAPSTGTQHITLIVRNRWNAQITSIDIPEYTPGSDTGTRSHTHEVIDIIYW